MANRREPRPTRRAARASPFVAGLLSLACSGGGGGGSSAPPPPPEPAAVTIAPAAALLAGVGQARTLSASVLDLNGVPISSAVTWSSSAPDQVSVDANGKVTGLQIGSAKIFAQAGTVRSDPVMVMVADPAPGALLLADAQVIAVGPFVGVAAGDLPDVGTQYEVQVRGVSPAPAPGTIVLATEASPVAGRVVSTRVDAGVLVLVLEVVALPDLMRNATIDWAIDLGEYDWSRAARASRGRVRLDSGSGEADIPFQPFKEFDCGSSFDTSILHVDKTITPTGRAVVFVGAVVVNGVATGEQRVELQVTYGLDALVKIAIQGDIQWSGSCTVQELKPINVFGWFSLIATIGVKFGAELDVNVDLLATVAELDLDGTATMSFSEAVSCPPEGDCVTVADPPSPDVQVKPTFKVNENPALRVKLEGYLFGFVSLDGLLGQGEVADVELLKAQFGPDQTSDLAFEDSQAKDTSYASSDQLKLKGSLQVGGGIAKVLKKLGAKAAAATISTLKVPFGKDVSKSPAGTLAADKTQVGLGDKVKLTVDLDPSRLEYFGFGYNVQEVQLWRRKPNAGDFQVDRTVSFFPLPGTGQTHFEAEWKPTADDVGTNTVVAMVVTKFQDLVALEIGADTQKDIAVLCFPPHTAAATGRIPAVELAALAASSATCEDVWTGSSSTLVGNAYPIDASVTWHVDPSTIIGSGLFYYYPLGTVTQHPWTDAQGCRYTYSPGSYQISQPHDPQGSGTLTVDYATDPNNPAYGGIAVTEWQATVTRTCPDGSSTSGVSIAGGAWFQGQGTLAPDWLSFSGPYTSTNLGQTFTYQFTRPAPQ